MLPSLYVTAINLIILVCNFQTLISEQIPIDANRWYQLNTGSTGVGFMFDGILQESGNVGWGKMFTNYEIYYPLLSGEKMEISQVKMYDAEGICVCCTYNDANIPFTMYVEYQHGNRSLLATFEGLLYNAFVGPYPDDPFQFSIDTPLGNFERLVMVMTSNWCLPTEIEFFGSYVSPVLTQYPRPNVKFSDTVGVNAFEWDFLSIYGDSIDPSKFEAISSSFNQVRHYLDWDKLEPEQYQNYTFDPSHAGGWNYDAMYETSFNASLLILSCIKTLPSWMVQTYPVDEQNSQNVPLPYVGTANYKNYTRFSVPQSYILQAKMAFQFAARYGSTKVDPHLLRVNSRIRWFGDGQNIVKTGLGVIKYMECDNERDKWWLGRPAFQTSYEYAADMSAWYDGHLNTMGVGVGVKNADPTMQVVMAGLASADPSYVVGMVEWSKVHRGYLPNGKVNLPFDIINYHLYSNDASSSQGGSSSRGMAPEVSNAGAVARAFVNITQQFAENIPVWITETGYDLGEYSPYHVPTIGNKSALMVQADWILRTSLMYARIGVSKVFFYELYDDNPDNIWGAFATSGLLDGNRNRRPGANYLWQANKLIGNHSFVSSLSSDPFVDLYQVISNVTGAPDEYSSIYVMGIPDEKDRCENFVLALPTSLWSCVEVYIPTPYGKTMFLNSTIPNNSGHVSIAVSETPVFVVPRLASATIQSTQPSISASTSPSFKPSVNPTNVPSSMPSLLPFLNPSNAPLIPSPSPSVSPSSAPSKFPSLYPSATPTVFPYFTPTLPPYSIPSSVPSGKPTFTPTIIPSLKPSIAPTISPSQRPTSLRPTHPPTVTPSLSLTPSVTPTTAPTSNPSKTPSMLPTNPPTRSPTIKSLLITKPPTSAPTVKPSSAPTLHPSRLPTLFPSPHPSRVSCKPSTQPSTKPLTTKSNEHSIGPPSLKPSAKPSPIEIGVRMHRRYLVSSSPQLPCTGVSWREKSLPVADVSSMERYMAQPEINENMAIYPTPSPFTTSIATAQSTPIEDAFQPTGPESMCSQPDEQPNNLVHNCVYSCDDRQRDDFTRIVLDDSVQFDSHFESANLHSAYRALSIPEAALVGVKLRRHLYDLYIHPDIGAAASGRAPSQWFFFRAKNLRFGQRLRIRIKNFRKATSLFSTGMRPLVYSGAVRCWSRDCTNVSYGPTPATNSNQFRSAMLNVLTSSSYSAKLNSTRMKRFTHAQAQAHSLSIINSTSYYTLSFDYCVQCDDDECYFAYCLPYTYTDLQRYLQSLSSDPLRSVNCRRSLLSRSLAGNRVDLLTVTAPAYSPEEVCRRPIVVVTARVHPGETHASFIAHGLVDFLTGDSAEAAELRKTFVFKIMPMLNPDGVVNGNYRTSLSGHDLNRQWRSPGPSPALHPETGAVKDLLHKLVRTRPGGRPRSIALLLDLHGHSARNDVFMYGCLPGPSMARQMQQLRPRDPLTLHPALTTITTPERMSPRPAQVDHPLFCAQHNHNNGPVSACPEHAQTTPRSLPLGAVTAVDVQRWRTQLLPRLLSRVCDAFTLESCSFNMHKYKAGCLRMVAFLELGIDGAYTLEASLAGSGGTHFTARRLLAVGRDLGLAVHSATPACTDAQDLGLMVLAATPTCSDTYDPGLAVIASTRTCNGSQDLDLAVLSATPASADSHELGLAAVASAPAYTPDLGLAVLAAAPTYTASDTRSDTRARIQSPGRILSQTANQIQTASSSMLATATAEIVSEIAAWRVYYDPFTAGQGLQTLSRRALDDFERVRSDQLCDDSDDDSEAETKKKRRKHKMGSQKGIELNISSTRASPPSRPIPSPISSSRGRDRSDTVEFPQRRPKGASGGVAFGSVLPRNGVGPGITDSRPKSRQAAVISLSIVTAPGLDLTPSRPNSRPCTRYQPRRPLSPRSPTTIILRRPQMFAQPDSSPSPPPESHTHKDVVKHAHAQLLSTLDLDFASLPAHQSNTSKFAARLMARRASLGSDACPDPTPIPLHF